MFFPSEPGKNTHIFEEDFLLAAREVQERYEVAKLKKCVAGKVLEIVEWREGGLSKSLNALMDYYGDSSRFDIIPGKMSRKI